MTVLKLTYILISEYISKNKSLLSRFLLFRFLFHLLLSFFLQLIIPYKFICARACLKNAFREMCFTVCGECRLRKWFFKHALVITRFCACTSTCDAVRVKCPAIFVSSYHSIYKNMRQLPQFAAYKEISWCAELYDAGYEICLKWRFDSSKPSFKKSWCWWSMWRITDILK